MRAIHRFKCLISKSKASTPDATTVRTFSSLGLPSRIVVPGVEKMKNLASSILPDPQPLSSSSPNDMVTSSGKTAAEEASELVKQRREFVELRGSTPVMPSPLVASGDSSARTHEQPNWPPPGLGIHTDPDEHGQFNDATGTAPTEQHIVSDSPTGIDFDDQPGESIYDRAFSAEIKRIRSQKHKERAKTYLTRLVGEKEIKKWEGDDYMIVEAGRSLAKKSGAIGGSGKDSFGSRNASGGGDVRDLLASRLESAKIDVQEGKANVDGVVREQGMKFADLVAQMGRAKQQAGSGAAVDDRREQAQEM